MAISKTELGLLYHIAKGEKKIKEIHTGKSISQLYRTVNNLKRQHLLNSKRGSIELNNSLHLNLLVQNILKNPNLINILSDSGMAILMNLTEPKQISEISQITRLKKSIIYRKLKQCFNSSIVIKKDSRYILNRKIWPDLIEFLLEYKKYYENIDNRIPTNAKIYYKNEKEILFSSKQKLDAELTAFSAYSKYGIKIYTITNYYYLSKGKLTKKKIFLHSLLITDKEFDYRNITYIALFYMKHKQSIKAINHEIFKNIKHILNGGDIEGYPKLKEIQAKAEQYGIR